MSLTATVAISASTGLVGVALGAGIDYLRERRHDNRDTTRADADRRGAARLVYLEVSGFQNAVYIAAGTPRVVKDQAVVGLLLARDRLDANVATLARDEHCDIDIIEAAYASAQLAVDALLNDAPPDETRDKYGPTFVAALDMLRAMGQIPIRYDEHSQKLARPRAPGKWPPN